MWCYTLFPVILNMTLTASLVILLVSIARLLLRRAPRVISYALWLVVLFRLLCPVSFSSPLSVFHAMAVPVSEEGALEFIPDDIVHRPDPEVTLPVPGVSEWINDRLPQGEEQTVADPLEAPMALATLVWLTGMGGMVLWGLFSLLRLRRRLTGAVRLEGRVWLADGIATPFVLGLFRPKIYLPSGLAEGERGYILLHERIHIRRLDHVTRLLAFAALCLHWFNPLVWLAFFLSGRDMELSCDEAVLRRAGTDIRADYSASLLRLSTGRRFLPASPLAFGEGNPGERIRSALRYKRPAFWVVLVSVIAAAGLAFILLANSDVHGQYLHLATATLTTETDFPAYDTFSFQLEPGQSAEYGQPLDIGEGEQLLYSITWSRSSLYVELGLRGEDGTEYAVSLRGGSEQNLLDDLPAGTYTLFVRSSEDNLQWEDTTTESLTVTGAATFRVTGTPLAHDLSQDGPLSVDSMELWDWELTTNSEKLSVTVEPAETGVVVSLYDWGDRSEPIRTARISGVRGSCTFDGLSGAHTYAVAVTGSVNAPVLVTD